MNKGNTKIEIKHAGTLVKSRGNKTIGGIFSVAIYENEVRMGSKKLPLLELKKLSGVYRINQNKAMQEWLNTEEGLRWCLDTLEVSITGG